MAQSIPPYCPRCGTPTVAGQRFCANCGLVMRPTITADHALDNPAIPTQATSFTTPAQQQQPGIPSGWGSASVPPAMPLSSPPEPFSAARVATARRKRGRLGVLLVLLVLLLLIGIGSYVALNLLHGGSASGGTQPPITTTPLNTTVTYAGVTLTIVNAQQADSFVHDPNTATDGMLRLTIQEQNPTASRVSWLYSDIARILLPDKSVVSPTFVNATVGIAPGATQRSTVDFAVPHSDKLNQLTLLLGAANEAQLSIPLRARVDLSKYAPKSVSLNGQMVYLGLNYTLTKATSQLSIDGQQAKKGMKYVVVTLSVDNTLSQLAIAGSAYDYIRLQSGQNTATPVNTTLPVSFDTGVTGKIGTVSFLVPNGSTAFTLVLLPQSQSGATQASTDFQIA